MSGDTKLALAIIYTETKGKQVDIMQSSESLNGTTNTFSTEQESIKQGISNLSKVLEYASQKRSTLGQGFRLITMGRPMLIT